MPNTVLIVDDTEASRDTLEALLFKEGYRLEFADSAWSCLEFLESELPDLIVMDVMMPGMTGFELCEKLKNRTEYEAIPVILLTALNKKEDVIRGLEAGAEEFVSKPVSGPEIRARVRNLLRTKILYDELQKTLQFRQDVTRFLVHDMRNPLVSIRIQAELGKLDAKSTSCLEHFDKILNEAATLDGYVGEMLLEARAESGTLTLDTKVLDLVALVKTWAQQQDEMANHEITLDLPDSVVLICGDSNLLNRMLDNLFSNASKYAADSSVSLSLSRDGDSVRLAFSDRGSGIPDDYKMKVFERYGVAPTELSRSAQTGLGLYFCRLVCEAHGGYISVEDAEPSGARFVISLTENAGS